MSRRAQPSTRALGFSGLLVLALLQGLTLNTAWAHGGGVLRLTNVEAGPYWVSVWTQPDPLRVGQAHITVAVFEPNATTGGRREAGVPILDATVLVQVQPLDRAGEALSVAATHEGAANKLFYEADLELPETGQWRVTVSVAGPDGSGSADFDTQVVPPSRSNLIWIGGLGVAAVAAFWIVQRLKAPG